MNIRRVLVIADDDFATQALDEAVAAFGLFVRRVRRFDGSAGMVDEFGPDAVILDPDAVQDTRDAALAAVAASGAALLLLGSPDDPGLGILRQAAADAGLRVDGLLTKPLATDSLEIALRVVVGELGFTAADITGAVMRGEMTAWYQLQLDRTPDGWRASGAEALARWQHPEHGLVMPGAFLPVAESEGLIALITDCVLQNAVQQLSVWHRQGMHFRVGVNVSPALMQDHDFPDRLSRLLDEYDVPAHALVMEIREPALGAVPDGFRAMLARLRVLGFGLSLERFGYGVSSVADLYRTPFSELKISRRLISRLDEDEDTQHLVRGIIALARELELEVCAEAVETREALEFLHAAECTRAQGFQISRPLPAAAFQVVAKQWL
ncbi:MAG: EAL domain-containing protein [Gammaproteobacteria bacterium]|jgi:EAL domain-containing protein (putative c-di-GMP-specific phosphodiesterase class I)